MSRTRIQQMAVVVLLIAFIAIWTLTRSEPVPGPLTVPAPVSSSAGAPAGPDPQEEKQAWDLTVQRDPYRPPKPVLEKIATLERAERDRLAALERERKAARQTGQAEPAELASPVEPPSLTVQGILFGTARPQAIINRKIVAAGDTVEGARVVSITAEGVVMSFEEREFELKIPFRSDLEGSRSQSRDGREPDSEQWN